MTYLSRILNPIVLRKNIVSHRRNRGRVPAPATDPVFEPFLTALKARHLKGLELAEIRRGLQGLSRAYVSRQGLGPPEHLRGAARRAAFALFYGPLHFMVVSGIVAALSDEAPVLDTILDLGCGTGVAGAAWALQQPRARVRGVDRSGWATEEARWTLRQFHLKGLVRRTDISKLELPRERGAVVAAYVLNELGSEARDTLLSRLLRYGERGSVLVVESIARKPIRWWDDWAERVSGSGGRADEWQFSARLPEILAQLDRASGLDHRTLKARSLWLSAPKSSSGQGPSRNSSHRKAPF